MTDPRRPVLLETAHSPFEADVIVGVLQEAGIPAFRRGSMLTDEFALSQQLMNAQGVQVFVPEELLESAQQALAAAREAGQLLDGPPAEEPDEEPDGKPDGKPDGDA